MPNWCSNQLYVVGKDVNIHKFIIKSSKNDGGNIDPYYDEYDIIESHIPTPKQNLDNGSWYEWRLANWGCKWSDSETKLVGNTDYPDNIKELIFDFETPWSPPIEAIKTISSMYPKLGFAIFYSEPGMGFEGNAKFVNGEITHEEEREMIAEIDGISGNFEYEFAEIFETENK
jgi:hypothetical protein